MNETTFTAWTLHHHNAAALDRELELRRRSLRSAVSAPSRPATAPLTLAWFRQLFRLSTAGQLRPAV